MLARVVKSAGESCPGGYRTFFQGVDDSKAGYWNVSCGASSDRMVTIASDSSTKVLSCAVMDALARKKSCWIDWGSSPGAAKYAGLICAAV
ncbi:MAG: hypothetical protein IPF48_03440 [Sphingomonadales bacterium]|nr:hypothetical protein [Sphingomonadales bacterium]MBK6492352.1 hypothetical protein [Sphingomonadales bacterium]MBK6720777.1 hypothetical protein [Sphingomonadales bacterium]MBK8860575.1 hypothetical protein [Sphingomonadales bacterium]